MKVIFICKSLDGCIFLESILKEKIYIDTIIIPKEKKKIKNLFLKEKKISKLIKKILWKESDRFKYTPQKISIPLPTQTVCFGVSTIIRKALFFDIKLKKFLINESPDFIITEDLISIIPEEIVTICKYGIIDLNMLDNTEDQKINKVKLIINCEQKKMKKEILIEDIKKVGKTIKNEMFNVD